MAKFIITTKDVSERELNCALTKNDSAKIIAPIATILNVNDVVRKPHENASEDDHVWIDGWNSCLDFLFDHAVSLEELDFCSEIKTPATRIVVDKDIDATAYGFDMGWNCCIEHTKRLNHARACQNNNKR